MSHVFGLAPVRHVLPFLPLKFGGYAQSTYALVGYFQKPKVCRYLLLMPMGLNIPKGSVSLLACHRSGPE